MSNDNHEMFFRHPLVIPNIPDTFGTLYLLRRDILTCLGKMPGASGQALWPGAMAILAGFDLLGKFWKGTDQFGEVEKRYCGFIGEYLPGTDVAALYQLRNALLHSFGLYSMTKSGEYHFVLTAAGIRPLITALPGGRYCIDVLSLWEDFEKAVDAYYAALTRDVHLQHHFETMLPRYGSIEIGGTPCIS